MGMETTPETPVADAIATPDISPIEMNIAPPTIISPISGSLGDKIGGFADELR